MSSRRPWMNSFGCLTSAYPEIGAKRVLDERRDRKVRILRLRERQDRQVGGYKNDACCRPFRGGVDGDAAAQRLAEQDDRAVCLAPKASRTPPARRSAVRLRSANRSIPDSRDRKSPAGRCRARPAPAPGTRSCRPGRHCRGRTAPTACRVRPCCRARAASRRRASRSKPSRPIRRRPCRHGAGARIEEGALREIHEARQAPDSRGPQQERNSDFSSLVALTMPT